MNKSTNAKQNNTGGTQRIILAQHSHAFTAILLRSLISRCVLKETKTQKYAKRMRVNTLSTRTSKTASTKRTLRIHADTEPKHSISLESEHTFQ